MNKAANTIHSPDDGLSKDFYGWDPMLDGDSDDTNFDKYLDMPDDLSGNTRRMMDQLFARSTHASISKDFMGLEDTLNNVLQRLGEVVESDPAEEVQALHAHEDFIRSRKQGDTDGTSNIVLPCPSR